MQSLILCAMFVVTLVCSQPVIIRDWTQVNVQTGSSGQSASGFPRAGSFSDGRYIIVYTIQTSDSSAVAVGQIFHANGSVSVGEFELADEQQPTDVIASPNVVVFNDDTFLVVFGCVTENSTMLRARRFNSDGSAAIPSLNIIREDDPNPIDVDGIESGVELVGFADKSFSVFYYSSPAQCYVGWVLEAGEIPSRSGFCLHSAQGSVSASVASDRARVMSYIVSQKNDTTLNLASVKGYGPRVSNEQIGSGSTPSVALVNHQLLIAVYIIEDSLFWATSQVPFNNYTIGTLLASNSTVSFSSPKVISLSDNRVLIAYRSKNLLDNSERIKSSVCEAAQILSLIPSSFRVVPMSGSNVLVVAKNPVNFNIRHQILSFCGNGHVELSEDCDGGPNCDAKCRCTNGLIGYNGVCGSPNVVPVLDCVTTNSSFYLLYFSFINEDGTDYTLEHGELNSFTPGNLAGDRPTVFSKRSTLTYPASPYFISVPSSVTQFTWLLGSYNLTVDLTSVESLKCPENVGFVVDIINAITVSETLTAMNFAARYGVSLDRVNASLTEESSTTKRYLYDTRHFVTITVIPSTDSSTANEPTPAKAVRSVLLNYANPETRFATITALLFFSTGSSAANVVNISPLPTGVSILGVRYEISPVAEPTSAPMISPVAGTTPMTTNVSSAAWHLPNLAIATLIWTSILY